MGSFRGSLLWNGVTWAAIPSKGISDFHLGPLLSVEKRPAGRRIALGNGLLGLAQGPAGGWRPFWFEFSRKQGQDSSP